MRNRGTSISFIVLRLWFLGFFCQGALASYFCFCYTPPCFDLTSNYFSVSLFPSLKKFGFSLGISSFAFTSFPSAIPLARCLRRILFATSGNLVNTQWLLALPLLIWQSIYLRVWCPGLFLYQLLACKTGLYSVVVYPVHPTECAFISSSAWQPAAHVQIRLMLYRCLHGFWDTHVIKDKGWWSPSIQLRLVVDSYLRTAARQPESSRSWKPDKRRHSCSGNWSNQSLFRGKETSSEDLFPYQVTDCFPISHYISKHSSET